MPKFIDIPTEQTTAVTDALLALLALAGFFYLRRIGQADPWKAGLWSWTMALLAFAALVGTVAHGFKMSPETNRLFWHPLNLALGLTIALFVAGVVYDAWGLPAARRVLPVMVGIGVVFFGITVAIPGTFRIFIVYEGLGMLFALGVYAWLAATGRLPGAGLMAAGVLVTMIAAAIQASDSVSLTFIWPFDHNGLYHLIQMGGVLLLLAGLRAALLSPLALADL